MYIMYALIISYNVYILQKHYYIHYTCIGNKRNAYNILTIIRVLEVPQQWILKSSPFRKDLIRILILFRLRLTKIYHTRVNRQKWKSTYAC